jgi:hypothetical protein
MSPRRSAFRITELSPYAYNLYDWILTDIPDALDSNKSLSCKSYLLSSSDDADESACLCSSRTQKGWSVQLHDLYNV